MYVSTVDQYSTERFSDGVGNSKNLRVSKYTSALSNAKKKKGDLVHGTARHCGIEGALQLIKSLA